MSREALAHAYRALGRAGLIEGSSGNVSVRTEVGMLISPTGTTPEQMTPEAAIAMPLDQPEPGASSEWELHGSLYAARPEFGAIVHTHADACTALACLGRELPPFHYGLAGFGGDSVRCARYETFGTPALARATVGAMRGRSACLLANHGMIAAGPDPASAVAAAQALERLCRQYLLALSAGSPVLLTPAQMRDAQERYRSYGKR